MGARIAAWVGLIGVVEVLAGAESVEAMPTLGATSRATLQISLSVSSRLQFEARSSVTSEFLDQEQSFCLWGNSTVGTYEVTLLRANPSTIEWANGGSEHALEGGETLRALKVTAGAADCASGNSVNGSLNAALSSAQNAEAPVTLLLGLE